MRIIFLGATKFSLEILEYLLTNDTTISAIFGIPENFSISYSREEVKNYNYADLKGCAEKNQIPYYEVNSAGKKLTDYYEIIEEIDPDVILVIGWYYMLPKKIRNLAKFGAWGIHASLLPEYAGGAPLVWSIIEGCEETGVTLFRLEDGVDDGDIIQQASFKIEETDSIKEVYVKATSASKEILLRVLKKPDSIIFTKQNKSKIKIYPQRKPEDGEIDLNKKAKQLYDFIRAQSNPYPGAFIKTIDGKKLIIEKARIEE